MGILTRMGSAKPEIGDSISFLLDKWDGKQFYLLIDNKSWLVFELTRGDKMALLKMLVKDWLQ